jgi:DNA-binding ferritin-like protein
MSMDLQAATMDRMAQRVHAIGTISHAALAFAEEKRRVDAQAGLDAAHSRMLTELVNSLRQLTQQIKA